MFLVVTTLKREIDMYKIFVLVMLFSWSSLALATDGVDPFNTYQ